MYSENDFSRLELSTQGFRSNYRYFRSLLRPSTKLLVLVKANAYGHGAVEFASLLQAEGADYLAVALPIEGVQLRRNGISLPILVLTSGVDFFPEIVDYKLEPGIPNLYTLQSFCAYLDERGIAEYPVHIKLDTGMHRLGFMSSELEELCEFLKSHPQVKVKSIYSHLSDAECREYSLSQIDKFQRYAAAIGDALGYKPMWHVLNSAGIQLYPEYQFDMVRLGIGIYGISAVSDVKLSVVASLKVKVLQVKHLTEEDGAVGYGRHGKIAASGTSIATIPVGYADGVDRRLGCGAASFELNGHLVPTIGNICMDMTMLDVTGLDVKAGDTVTIFGRNPRIETLAETLGTIPYEIFTSIPQRIERIIKK